MKKIDLINMLFASAILTSCVSNDSGIYLVAGSFTDQTSTGLRVFEFDQNSADISLVSENSEVSNPSYMATSASGNFLWVTGTNKEPVDSVYTFSFNKAEGVLKKISSTKAYGGSPCYISSDKDESYVLTANYNGGNISFFDIREDNTLSPLTKRIDFSGGSIHPKRQKKPYLHSVVFSNNHSELLAADLGRDLVYHLRKDEEGSLALFDSIALEPGSGPRHIAISESGNMAYVICELSGMVATLKKDNGRFKPVHYIIADSIGGESSADIHLSADNKYIYASVRDANDGIAVYGINESGIPEFIEYTRTARHPRNFTISPNGKYLLVACRNDNVIQIYRINPNGTLHDTGKSIECPRAVCLKWIEA